MNAGDANAKAREALPETVSILRRAWLPQTVLVVALAALSLIGIAFHYAVIAALAVVVLVLLARIREIPFAAGPPVRLAIDEQSVRANGVPIVDRGLLVEGVLWPTTGQGVVVELRRGGMQRPIELRVGSVQEGRAVLRALCLDGGKSRTRFRVPARPPIAARWLFAAAFVAFVGPRASHPPLASTFAPMVAFALFGLALLAAWWPATVTLGADAIAIDWLFRRTLIRYADLRGCEAHERGIRFVLRDGRVVDVRTNRKAGKASVRDAIVERLDEVRAGARGADASTFDRGGRSIFEWVKGLRALSGQIEDFRRVPLDEEAMWRAFENPHGTATSRIGAAVALANRLDEGGRAKLRVAAEAMVSPRMRVAVEAAVDRDDERLREAVEGMEREG